MTTERPEHRHLRSALEFAVEIARAGQKLRPPLPVPPGIRKFVKMQRVPSGTLGQLRRVLEDDPVFRQRLAAAATPELVDEVGLLWLRRPESWETRVDELLAAAQTESEQADAQTALRREQRRREAAEQAAVRARVEIAALHERVEELTGEVEQHRQRSSTHDADIAQLRADLIQARTDARHAHDRANAAAGKLERLEAERRTPATPDRVEAPPDPNQVRDRVRHQLEHHLEERRAADKLISDRLSALNASAQRFAEQLDELRAFHDTESAASASAPAPAPAPAAPATASAARRVKRTESRRRLLSIPGGVAASSQIAAQHLLSADAAILVDGYNVSMLGWPDLPLAVQRTALLDAAESLAHRSGADLTVVFDGADVVGSAADQRRVVRVVYSPPDVPADDVIRAEVQRLPASRAVVVVTNDGEIRRDVRAMGANVVSSDRFLSLSRR